MRRARLFLAALVLTSAASGMLGASAGHCGSGSGRPHDPFGSCEHGDEGRVRCGSMQGLPIGAITTARSGEGVQACAAGSEAPAAGRAGVWHAPDGTVTVFVDGDESTDVGSEVGWKRVDVDADDACAARVREGERGQWANDYEGNGATDSTTESDTCHSAPR